MKFSICNRFIIVAFAIATILVSFISTAHADSTLLRQEHAVNSPDNDDETSAFELMFQKYYIDADGDGVNDVMPDETPVTDSNTNQSFGILSGGLSILSSLSDLLLTDLLGIQYKNTVNDVAKLQIWGQLNIRLTEAQAYSTGQNVTVAVLDTGLWPNHDLIPQEVMAGYDFVDNDSDPKDELNGIDDNNNGEIDEGAGHGTHVSSIILSGAPDIKLMPLRILNSDGRGTPESAALAIRYAVEHGADIINLSLSGAYDSPELVSAVQYAHDQGVLLVAAASSSEQGRLDYPAAYPTVLSVGSINASNELAAYVEPYASLVDVFAPGSIIFGAYHSNSSAWIGGNSMATAFVSATAALLMQNPECDAECARNAILSSSVSVQKNANGAKRVDAVSALVGTAAQIPGAKPEGFALRCDGVNDLVQGRSLPSYSPFTVEFWVNMSDVNSEQIIFAQADVFNSIFLYTRNNKLHLASYAIFSSDKTVYDQPLVAHQWSHVAIVYDGRSTMKLFVDGQHAGSIRKRSSYNFSLLDLCGRKYSSNSFAGLIDDFHITKRAKYGSSFQKPTGSLEADSRSVLLWTMEEVDNRYLPDEARGYNRGIMSNFDNKQLSLWPVALLDPLLQAASFSDQGSLVLEELIPTEPAPQIMLPFIVLGE